MPLKKRRTLSDNFLPATWNEMYQRVAQEWGMPPRKPKGHPSNKRRMSLGPRIAREAQRRLLGLTPRFRRGRWPLA